MADNVVDDVREMNDGFGFLITPDDNVKGSVAVIFGSKAEAEKARIAIIDALKPALRVDRVGR